MNPRYRDAIDNASADLSQALLEDIPKLLEQGLRLDALVREALCAVVLALFSALYQGLCAYLLEQDTALGRHRTESPHGTLQDLVWRDGNGVSLLAQLLTWRIGSAHERSLGS